MIDEFVLPGPQAAYLSNPGRPWVTYILAWEVGTAMHGTRMAHEVCVQMARKKTSLTHAQTGMEIAAEAKEAGAEEVTLVHSSSHLCKSEKQGKVPLRRLEKIGVTVILGEHAKPACGDGKTYIVKGVETTFDEVFQCTGGRPATDFVKPLGSVLTATGAMDVNASLQVCTITAAHQRRADVISFARYLCIFTCLVAKS
jgi:hypothetical protein